jgi:hypothetical protein
VPAPASGDSTKFLKGDGTWATSSGGSSSLSVVSKTANYTASTSDDAILCSGSAFTVTLPTAVGNTGKRFYLKKTDSSTSNIITVATTALKPLMVS